MTEFKVGDRVRCLTNKGTDAEEYLRVGGEYTVAEIVFCGRNVKPNVKLDGVDQEWCVSRFELVETAAQPGLQQFASGAVRSKDANGTRYDLISPIALEALAETYAEGAAKYGDCNWLKGIPTNDLLNHALRHLLLWQRGDTSEPHLAHAAWNIMAMIHFEKTRPELVMRPFAVTETKGESQ